MKRISKLFMLAVLLICGCQFMNAQKVAIFVEKTTNLDDDEQAAYNWFHDTYGGDKKEIVGSLAAEALSDVTVLWIPIDRVGCGNFDALPDYAKNSVEVIKEFVKRGGNLLLTNHANLLVDKIGRCNMAPNVVDCGDGESKGKDDVWGINVRFDFDTNDYDSNHDHRSHPIFKDLKDVKDDFNNFPLTNGTWRENHNCMWNKNVNEFQSENNAVALATWSNNSNYVKPNIVEFKPAGEYKGTVISIGVAAYEWNSTENGFQYNIIALTEGCFSYLKGLAEKKPTFDYADVAIFVEKTTDFASDDEKAAYDWFVKTYTNGPVITPENIGELSDVKVLWIPIDRNGIGEGVDNLPEAYKNNIEAFKAFVKRGGRLYLTNHAVQLVRAIDRIAIDQIEDSKMSTGNFNFGSGDGSNNVDSWGVTAIIGAANECETFDNRNHDIYKGLVSGNGNGYPNSMFPLIGGGNKEDHNCVWILDGEKNNTDVWKLKIFQNNLNCKVLGNWQQINDYYSAAVVEFYPTGEYQGTILANGIAAYEWNQNDKENVWQSNLEKLTANSIEYLRNVDTFVHASTGATFRVDDEEGVWGTFYCDHANTLPEGVDAYYVKSVNEKNYAVVAKVEGRVIPGKQGFLLRSNEAVAHSYLTQVDDSQAPKITDNMLYGTETTQTVAEETGYKYYILGKKTVNGVANYGFYWAKGTNEGATVNNNAHKAYLKVPASAAENSAKAFILTFNDHMTDGIENVNAAEATDGIIYNLAGQRVGKSYKGLVVKNGKTFIQK